MTLVLLAGGHRYELERSVMLVERDFPVQRLTVAAKMVNPPDDVLERIRREGVATREGAGDHQPGTVLVPPVPSAGERPGWEAGTG